MEWYLKVIKNYAGFSGRARRKEFWMFILFNILVAIVLTIIDNVLGLTFGQGTGILATIYSLAVLIPSLAVDIRRLHDIGKSGWWLLIAFVPLIGVLVLFYWFVQDSESGANQYGENPKG